MLRPCGKAREIGHCRRSRHNTSSAIGAIVLPFIKDAQSDDSWRPQFGICPQSHRACLRWSVMQRCEKRDRVFKPDGRASGSSTRSTVQPERGRYDTAQGENQGVSSDGTGLLCASSIAYACGRPGVKLYGSGYGTSTIPTWQGQCRSAAVPQCRRGQRRQCDEEGAGRIGPSPTSHCRRTRALTVYALKRVHPPHCLAPMAKMPEEPLKRPRLAPHSERRTIAMGGTEMGSCRALH